MNVLFMGVGLVHYFNPILNRLQQRHGIRITNLIPGDSRGHLQPGVHTSLENVCFKVARLNERGFSRLYRGFSGLDRLLYRERPEIIVYTDYYMNLFLVDLAVVRAVRRLGIKLIMKSIPFRLRTMNDALYDPDNVPKLDDYLPRCLRNKLNRPGLLKLAHRMNVRMNRAAFLRPDAHVCYVPEARDIYASYGVHRDRIFLTYNSPDTDHLLKVRSQLERTGGAPAEKEHRLIHVGRLVEWKRVDLLIRSMARLTREFPEAELVVVGDGPEKERLVSLVRELRLEKSIAFAGAVYDPSALGRHLLSSAVYVLGGMGGLSLNDAMCFGRPVICSICDGTEKAIVRDGVNGLFFRNGDVDDLTAKIRYMLSHPAERAGMGRQSTRIIHEEINVHTVISGYLQAFQFVTRPSSVRPGSRDVLLVRRSTSA